MFFCLSTIFFIFNAPSDREKAIALPKLLKQASSEALLGKKCDSFESVEVGNFFFIGLLT